MVGGGGGCQTKNGRVVDVGEGVPYQTHIYVYIMSGVQLECTCISYIVICSPYFLGEGGKWYLGRISQGSPPPLLNETLISVLFLEARSMPFFATHDLLLRMVLAGCLEVINFLSICFHPCIIIAISLHDRHTRLSRDNEHSNFRVQLQSSCTSAMALDGISVMSVP